MTPKTRDFRTTGVVMRIDEDWFRHSPGVKQRVADSLRDMMLREYSISAKDIDAAATNISMIRNGQREAVSDAPVLFDGTQGTLRLTEPAPGVVLPKDTLERISHIAGVYKALQILLLPVERAADEWGSGRMRSPRSKGGRRLTG